jgi:3-hydroxy-9,10-secoandrosta-1,3,5(10)-triene-9,17-dione monooxygenase
MTVTPTRVLTPQEALDAARVLAPRLRERAEATEAQRQISRESIAELIDSGLFGIATPRDWGGSELGYESWIRVTAEIAAACPATGWVYGVLLGHFWLAARFPLEAQREVFGNPSSLVASLFRLQGTTHIVDGGYRWQDGRGRFCSGVDHADWVISIANVAGEPHYVLIPRHDFDILDDWYTVGMRGTGSKSIRLHPDVFVPAHRSVPVGALGGGGFTASLVGAPLGIARGALGVYEETLRGRLNGSRSEQVAAMAPGFIRLSQAAAEIDFAFTSACAGASRLDSLNEGEKWSEVESAAYRRNQAYAVHLCRVAVNTLFEAGGGSGLYDHETLQRYWRDINAAASHTSNNWENAAVGYGYATLGLQAPRPQRR